MLEQLPKVFAKFALSGAVLGGIFWGVMTLYPSTRGVEVKPSDADILTFGFAGPSDMQKFSEALNRMGHETPRVYNMNENTVFFSTAVHPYKKPDEVLREYQEEFVRQGVNKKAYRHAPGKLLTMGQEGADEEFRAMQEGSLNGEVIPYQISSNHFAMGGTQMDLGDEDPDSEDFKRKVDLLEKNVHMISGAYRACGGKPLYETQPTAKKSFVETANEDVNKAAAKECASEGGFCEETRSRHAELSAELGVLQRAIQAQPHLKQCEIMKKVGEGMMGNATDEFARRVKSFKALEAFYDAERNMTHVSATWTDVDFDATKTTPNKAKPLKETNVSSRLPLCEGCERTWDFGGSGKETNYSVGQVTSPQSVRQTSDYYIRELTRKGWQVSEAQSAINEIYRLSGKQDDGNRWLRVVRGREHMTVHIRPGEGGSSRVTATTAN